MFVVTVTFRVAPGESDAFMDHMIRNARTSLEIEPGCHQFDVCANADGTDVFLYEVYDDEVAFKTHQGMDHYKAFSEATNDLIASKKVATYQRLG